MFVAVQPTLGMGYRGTAYSLQYIKSHFPHPSINRSSSTYSSRARGRAAVSKRPNPPRRQPAELAPAQHAAGEIASPVRRHVRDNPAQHVAGGIAGPIE